MKRKRPVPYAMADVILKVADLGLSRALVQDAYEPKSTEVVPFRTTSPEVFRSNRYDCAPAIAQGVDHNALMWCRFTKKSDVYALGTLLWQVWSNGAVPFEHFSTAEQTLQFLNTGTGSCVCARCGDRRSRVRSCALSRWAPTAARRLPGRSICADAGMLAAGPRRGKQTMHTARRRSLLRSHALVPCLPTSATPAANSTIV